MTTEVLRAARIDGSLRVASVVMTLAFVALLCFAPPSENDFWLQAKIGETIVQTGEIPRTLLFPFTWVRDNPFNAHEWLASIAFHVVDAALGYDRLVFVLGGLGLLQFGICFALGRWLSGSAAVGLLLAALAMLCANYRYHLRPEIFALLLMSGQLFALFAYQRSGRTTLLWWCLPISILWANVHGSFVLGPAIAGLCAAGEAFEWLRTHRTDARRTWLRGACRAAAPYAVVAAGMLLASMVNPLGPRLLGFVVELSASEVTKAFIYEWMPTLSPAFWGSAPTVIFVAILGGVCSLLVAQRQRVTVTDLLLVGSFALLAFQRTRFLVLFGFVALPVCARLLGGGRVTVRGERALHAATATAGVVGVALLIAFGNVRGAYPHFTPSSNLTEPMVRLLTRPDMRGNVFNSYELGAELTYLAYPRLRPSIDSRIDSYGDQYFLLHKELLRHESRLNDFVADFGVRYMLLTWRDFGHVKDMATIRQRWKMSFADHKSVLLERDAGRDPP